MNLYRDLDRAEANLITAERELQYAYQTKQPAHVIAGLSQSIDSARTVVQRILSEIDAAFAAELDALAKMTPDEVADRELAMFAENLDRHTSVKTLVEIMAAVQEDIDAGRLASDDPRVQMVRDAIKRLA